MNFTLIVAADANNGIGKANKLPWRLSKEMQHFTKITTQTHDAIKQNAVIMGRKTWESIPEKFRPLPGRLNIVLSRDTLTLPEGVMLANSLDEALQKASISFKTEKIFVLGGASVYQQAINHHNCQKIYLTRIQQNFNCDTFFPSINPEIFHQTWNSELQEEENRLTGENVQYYFQIFERKSTL